MYQIQRSTIVIYKINLSFKKIFFNILITRLSLIRCFLIQPLGRRFADQI